MKQALGGPGNDPRGSGSWEFFYELVIAAIVAMLFANRCDRLPVQLNRSLMSTKGEVVSFFSAFATSFGCTLLMGALIASWLFRSSGAPLVAKIAIPALIVALACTAPYQVNAMLGFPISASLATLPARAELIAFVALDNDSRVDLWLRQGGAPPRAYETTMTDKLKQTLRNAQNKLGHGDRVMLVKTQPGPTRTGVTERRASDEPGYQLDDSAFSLPQKG